MAVVNPSPGPNLTGSGVEGGYSPSDLASAYGIPSGGSGQTVAIVDAYDDPSAESDLATYRSQYGLPACTTGNGCFRKINQTGGTAYPAGEPGWGVEISLDVDMVSAACPACHILLVEATDNHFANLDAAENQAVAQGATEVSNSWGSLQFPEETSLDPNFNHPGIPTTFSAGDHGYEVEYPAAAPTVIAVGGTTLVRASNARGWAETAWGGTGSGCSSYESKPIWQHDSGCTHRTSTDTSAVADPETPLSIYDSYSRAGWILEGGTSAASPIVASIMALANQFTRSLTGGFGLYVNSLENGTGALDDVVSGSNGSCGGTYLCTAGTGYDGPTGLGSPYGAPSAASVATPSALHTGGTIESYGRDPNNHLVETSYVPSTNSWTHYDITASTGSGVRSDPTVVEAGGTIEVYARDPSNHLVETVYSPSTNSWSSYDISASTGSLVAGTPSVVETGGALEVYARDPSNHLIETVYTPTTNKWASYDLTASTKSQVAGDPRVLLTSGTIEVYARDPSNHLVETVYSPSTNSWSSYDISASTGSLVVSNPSIVVLESPSTIEIYASDPSGHLIETVYSSSSNKWASSDITASTGSGLG
jgi:hypothetical protein